MTDIADQLKLEIDTSEVRNAILNPYGERGVGGWAGLATELSVDNTGLAIAVDDKCLKATPLGSDEHFEIRADMIRVLPGQYVGATAAFYRPSGRTGTMQYQVSVIFYEADRETNAGGSATATDTIASGATTVTLAPVVAPAGAAFARIRLQTEVTPHPANPTYVSKVFVTVEDSSTPAVWALPDFTDVLGETFSISFEQGNELDGAQEQITPGVLTAHIGDATIDPAANDQVYRGAIVRLSALDGSDWVPQFTGTAEVFNTTYDGDNTVVTLTATDAAAALNRTQLDICGTASLAGVLQRDVGEAAAVLTDTGDGNELLNVSNREAYDPGSTVADWLRRACNTFGGYAWVDKHNVVKALAKADLSTATATFSDDYADTGATFYTGIEPSFSSEAIVNDLTVTRINRDEADHAKTYGPYLAPKSIRRWGSVPGRVEILDGTPADIADDLLGIFATPSIFPRQITFNATADISTATDLELFQKIEVKRAALIDDTYRLIKIRHTLTASNSGNKWLVDLQLRPLETTTAVTVISPAAGSGTGPADLIPAPAVTREPQGGIEHKNTPNGSSTYAIDFPIPYPSAPAAVVACVKDGTGNIRDIQAGTDDITASGFNLKFNNTSGSGKGSVGYAWIAIWE